MPALPSFLAPLAALALASPVVAQVAPSNLFVTTNRIIEEYTATGMLVRTINVPHPGGGITEDPRDVVVDANGDLHVFNGTFDPYLSTRRRATGLWEHHTFPGWATVNNVSYGGVDVVGPLVFVTDNLSNRGLIRFDQQQDFAATGFAESLGGFIDLTIGRDGLLYALSNNEVFVRVFDPATLQLLDTVILSAGVRGIAAGFDGTIFGASWDSNLYRFRPDGTIEATLAGSVGSLMDIDLDPFGNLAIGTRLGGVLVSDAALTQVTSFSTAFNSFAAFTQRKGPGVEYCESTANSTGSRAQIAGSGTESVSGADLTLTAAPLPAGSPYIFYVGTEAQNTPLGNGTSCVGGGMLRFPPQVAASGIAALNVFPDAALAAGTTVRLQCWYRDPAAGGARFNTSGAYVVQLVP